MEKLPKNRPWLPGGLGRAAFALILCLVSLGAFGLSSEADTCLACHSDKAVAPVVDLASMDKSVHAAFDCTVCHAGAKDLPHEATSLKADCSTCHSDVTAVYAKSVHGRAQSTGDKAAASCTSCHGQGHAILPASNPDSTVYHKNLPKTCGTCHSSGKIANAANVNVDTAYDLYADSIHGRAAMKSGIAGAANCADCHGSHDIQPKTDPLSPINRVNAGDTCGKCHVDVYRDWKGSKHADAYTAGNPKAPVCIDCHVAHTITQVNSASSFNTLIDECGTCHASQLESYRESFHGKVVYLGDTKVAKCADCHSAHKVLPSTDPLAPTNAANLTQTCQACHPGANASFAEYQTHAEYKNPAKSPLLFYIWVFMTLLLVGVFAFFGVHTILWLTHSLRTRKGSKGTTNKEGHDGR